MGKLNYICLGLISITSAFGQSAANFDTKIITPAAPAPAKPEKTAKPVGEKDAAAAAGPSVPSRYVGPAELEGYLGSLSSVFIAGTRQKDPFGHYQDPDAKPIVKPTMAKSAPRGAAPKATPLSEIIQLIAITTIMPKEKSFLVGQRKVKQNEELPLVWRGKQIRVQVVDVTAREITFRNVETGETGARQLDMIPAGMRSLTGNAIMVPGMVPDRPNAPIELETGDSAP